jgi:hypothetical protein
MYVTDDGNALSAADLMIRSDLTREIVTMSALALPCKGLDRPEMDVGMAVITMIIVFIIVMMPEIDVFSNTPLLILILRLHLLLLLLWPLLLYCYYRYHCYYRGGDFNRVPFSTIGRLNFITQFVTILSTSNSGAAHVCCGKHTAKLQSLHLMQ